MDSEHQNIKEPEKDKDNFSTISRIAISQPRLVQEAYQRAITLAIRETYLPQKENLPPVVFLEDVKSKLLNEFTRQIAEYETSGLIPDSYEADFFNFNLKSWVAFLDQRELIKASIDIQSHMQRNKGWEAPVWHPDPDYLEHLSKFLHDSGDITQKAFFLGNEKAKLFRPHEVEEIKKMLDSYKESK